MLEELRNDESEKNLWKLVDGNKKIDKIAEDIREEELEKYFKKQLENDEQNEANHKNSEKEWKEMDIG